MLVVNRKHASGPNAIEVSSPVRHSKRQATRSTGSIAIDSDERISIDNDPAPVPRLTARRHEGMSTRRTAA